MRRKMMMAALAASALALSACSQATPGPDSGAAPPLRVSTIEPEVLIPGRQWVAYDINMAAWAPLAFVNLDGSLDYLQAKSIESDDAVTWTITLRDGWTFHDGTPVTAQSYVDTWDAVAYGPNAFENSGQLAAIKGYGDLNPTEGDPKSKHLSGLTIVDDLTFTVELSAPDGQFPLQLTQTQTAMYPMPASAFGDFDAYNRHPVGNGPFMFTSDYEEGEPLVLEAYGQYQGPSPTIEAITFVPYMDAETAYTDVLAGNLDVATVPASKLTSAEADFGDRFYSFAAPAISFLGLPLAQERYQDIRVRQAISMAIDRETIAEVIYGGSFEPASAWTPAAELGTPVGICGEYCDYDPAAAAALLAEAGGFTGPMEISYPGGAGFDALYEAIANQLRQNLGIDASVSPSAGWTEFIQDRAGAMFTGPYLARWGALYPSQQATLRPFFIEGGGCANCIPWYSSEVAAAMTEADADLSGDGQAYVAVQEIIQAEFPAPPLFFESFSYVTSERVRSLAGSALGNPIYPQTRLD